MKINNSILKSNLKSKPYTYLLKHIPTGKLYCGAQWGKGCNPSKFWIEYFTSSKLVALYRTLFGDDCWKYEIRKIFKSGKDARKWERKVLRKMNAVHNPKWLNQTNGNFPIVFNVSEKKRQSARKNMIRIHKRYNGFKGKDNPMFGIQSPSLGTHWYNNGKVENMYIDGTQPLDFIRGRLPCSNEHKIKAGNASRNRQWINDGTNHKLILKNQPLPDGYQYGRITPWQ